MNISLSASQQKDVVETLTTLLSPFSYPSVDEWRLAVNRQVKHLVGADIAAFVIPQPGFTPVCTDDLPGMSEYLEKSREIRHLVSLKRGLQLKVLNRETLWHPNRKEVQQTAYYNDFLVPLRLMDSLGMVIPLSRHINIDTICRIIRSC